MPENLLVDVNDDGTIEPRSELEIETYYKPLDGIYIDHDNEFVACVMDDGPGMAETRIAFRTLLAAGFTIPPPSPVASDPMGAATPI
jgi:hypothetical protein